MTEQRDSEETTFGSDLNRFALGLYAQLRTRPGNLFFSPYSVRAALGLAQAGARSETAAQMRGALGAGAGAIVKRLAKGARGPYELAAANSLWVQEGAPLEREFLSVMERSAPGDIHLVDFGGSSGDVAERINAWVDERTKGRIRDIAPPGGFTSEACLALVDAIYFKGEWTHKFGPDDTEEQPFHLAGGGTVQAPLMRMTGRFRYFEREDCQAVDLSYMGDEVTMLVLLPKRVDGLAELEERLSASMLAECVEALSYTEIDLFLPRLEFTPPATDLAHALSALGMPDPFDRAMADFSGINGLRWPDDRALFLSTVLHRAFVEINEAGTEAAAVTVLSLRRTASLSQPTVEPPWPIFRADHPFLFAIRDRDTGAALFLGRVMDPTEGG